MSVNFLESFVTTIRLKAVKETRHVISHPRFGIVVAIFMPTICDAKITVKLMLSYQVTFIIMFIAVCKKKKKNRKGNKTTNLCVVSVSSIK